METSPVWTEPFYTAVLYHGPYLLPLLRPMAGSTPIQAAGNRVYEGIKVLQGEHQ